MAKAKETEKVSQVDMVVAALKACGPDADNSTLQTWIADNYEGFTVGTFSVTKSNAKKKLAKAEGGEVPTKRRSNAATAYRAEPSVRAVPKLM